MYVSGWLCKLLWVLVLHTCVVQMLHTVCLCLFVWLSVCASVCLSVHLSVCLCICLSVCASVCPSVHLSVRLCICLSVCASVCPDVTKVLVYLAQACHELVPPELVLPCVRAITDNFITERNSSEVMAVG